MTNENASKAVKKTRKLTEQGIKSQTRVNLILPITENLDAYLKMIDSIKDKNIKIFIGVVEKFKEQIKLKNKNVTITFFKNKSKKEEIINTLHSQISLRGKILIARRPLATTELTELLNSSADITTTTLERSKISTFFRNLLQKIIRRVFAFSYFDDISAVCFGENMFDIITSLTNLSYISRIDRFVGVERKEILSTTPPPKKEFDKYKTVLNFLFWFLIFGACVAGSVCMLCYLNITFLLILCVVALLLIACLVFAISLLTLLREMAVGSLRMGRAESV